MHLFPVVIVFFFAQAFSLVTYSDILYNFALSSETTYLPSNDSGSFFYPNDYFQKDVKITTNYIFILDSNNIISVYNRSGPTTLLSQCTTYRYSISSEFIVGISADLAETVLILTSFKSGESVEKAHSIGPNGVLTYINSTGYFTSATGSNYTMFSSNWVYTYVMGVSSNTFRIFDIVTNTINKTISIALVYDSIRESPNKQKFMLINSKNGAVFFYQLIPALPMEFSYKANISNQGYAIINDIAFSADSQLAVLEFDSFHPTIVLNLTDYSIVHSLNVGYRIYSTAFLDSSSRFLYMQCQQTELIYDLGVSPPLKILLNGRTPSAILTKVDHANSLLYSIGLSSIEVYGINISLNGIVYSFFYSPGVLETTTEPSQFYQNVEYGEEQKKALFVIEQGVSWLHIIIQGFFAVVYSSPFATYFLNTFNYFSFSSIYVLLNIKSPKIIFDLFSTFFSSSQSNFMETFKLSFELGMVSQQTVDDPRALNFEVSSDIVSKMYMDFFIVVGNFLLFEMVAFIVGIKCLRKQNLHRLIVSQRANVYYGLWVSNLMFIVLPWRFIIFEQFNDSGSKINVCLYYALVSAIIFFMVVCLAKEVMKAQQKQVSVIKAVRKWWVYYQNFIYPLLVLLQNPFYFLGAIGGSQLFFLYTSFQVPKRKALQVIKSLYGIVFNVSFIIFKLSEDNDTLAYTSIVCLITFLIGSAHYILEDIVGTLYVIYKKIRTICSKKTENSPNTDVGTVENDEIEDCSGVVLMKHSSKDENMAVKVVFDADKNQWVIAAPQQELKNRQNTRNLYQRQCSESTQPQIPMTFKNEKKEPVSKQRTIKQSVLSNSTNNMIRKIGFKAKIKAVKDHTQTMENAMRVIT